MRILLIEDDPSIRNSVKIALESESFIVDAFENGKKGSFMARTNEYDLILLDLGLPEKSGFEICQEIRESGKGVPIIVISVTLDPLMKVKLLNAGADDYLTKPFSYHELFARIRAILRRPSSMNSTIKRIGEVVLDSHKQKVVAHGKTVYLTRKEFCLLEYLMSHQSVVVSRGMIMEHVWNADSDPFSNTIEAHILNLRKKVDTNKTHKLIHTVPGRGYKLELQMMSAL